MGGGGGYEYDIFVHKVMYWYMTYMGGELFCGHVAI